ncbi:unnamed protein product [Effrenium voratum]|uniref:Acetyl-CoA carboxylase n=1 Tax=Effrenium voratum TaxID=2562239 RepID=A0AA36J6H5_9DINO|nr:unnamed protein product [Effrenium voratum]
MQPICALVLGRSEVKNYANVDLICKIAQQEKVDAVWPGWGHASENPRLPAKLKESGIAFIGPTSPVMSVLGDKIAAGILAQTAGVPSIPWSGDGLTAELTAEGTIPDETFKKACLNSVQDAVKCAERIGYPVMLKASEGGGGKGIRMSNNKEELEQNFPQVQAEVPGSPIFMMQLCTGARHIEVQIVGDQQGAVVALSGRDCSTQRRFQKIFEEGPPVIVPKATFKEMERAAQRLTASIGYIGAGTIEYLFNAQTGKFFFLELNPRLQVEHPVTEAITGVNLPATQLQVAMGVPLQRMPQVRAFYGRASADTTSSIDFMKDDYVYPKVHCMAARITAENPDDSFKPTSGKIERIKFQSSVACWGYFSVWTHAAIHEFADSQFGHLFARGGDREEARKTLVLALKNLEVVGEIRNPIDYLVELLGTKAFSENTIDTSWLDGLIRERAVKVKYEKLDVVFFAAVLRAVRTFEARNKDFLEAINKRRLGLLHQVEGACELELEICFEGHKFRFAVKRIAPDGYELAVAGKKFLVQVRVQPDGSLLVSLDGRVMKVSGTEEALGLRLRLQGVGTVLLPTIFDPSELRSDFNGKVIRYLIPEGGSVSKGQAYVELEAMKMVMSLKAGASGKVSHLKGPGAIVQAGEQLAKLQLDDPGSSPQLELFQGDFRLSGAASKVAEGASGRALLALDGFAPRSSAEALAQEILGSKEQLGEKLEHALQALERYLVVERPFAEAYCHGLSEDLAVARVIEAEADAAGLLRAHAQVKWRGELVAAILKGLEGLQAMPKETERGDREDRHLDRAQSQKLWQSVREEGHWNKLSDLLTELSELPPTAPMYAPVLLAARRLCQNVSAEPWEKRLQALKLGLGRTEAYKVATGPPHSAGCNLLAHLLEDKALQSKALEVLVRRSYRSFGVSKDSTIRVAVGPGGLQAKWKFRHPGMPVSGAMTVWQGLCKVCPDLAALRTFLSGDLKILDEKNDPSRVSRLHLILLGEEAMTCSGSEEKFQQLVQEVHQQLRSVEAKLKAQGSAEVILTVPKRATTLGSNSDEPRYAFFAERSSWTEVVAFRDLHATSLCLLEAERLAEAFSLEHLPSVTCEDAASEVFLASPLEGKAAKVLHVRTVSHTRVGFHPSSNNWASRLEALLLASLHEMECARLSPKCAGAEGRLFLNLTALADIVALDLFRLLESFVAEFVARHGALLQSLWVDEITLKVRLGEESAGCQGVLRFTAASGGEYMKCAGVWEEVDPVTGAPARWKDLATGEEREPVAADGRLRARRAAARKAGSTYAPEFLGLLEAALVKSWATFVRRREDVKPPKELLRPLELVVNVNGEVQEVEPRKAGSNDIGMLAWRLLLRTPEFPDGRSVVLIANDVTHQAGSFGVAEDAFFKKATEYARKRGLPRVYIACNSGARVGLVDEIMPKLKVQWKDASDPSKGFEYLYLTEADYKSLPSGAVVARPVQGVGYALEAVVGQGLKSTEGGIGVENLQGSGLIAGETSRAYNDIFTLSYVTGRSVGIGAYLNRLGQRVIQSVDGPLVLTGYSALNKLLGKNVYFSQDQLGGPQIMVPNGITHQLVQHDQEGAEKIMEWLSFVPRDTWSLPQEVAPLDPPSRSVDFRPTKQPYDPRHMLAGAMQNGQWVSGFFDRDSFVEYMAGWGRSVVVGRARLGGIPMGVIAVETRNVERRIPADPGNPESREIVEPQAGQVWFPDSAHKTATAIRDFNLGENLPLLIFANWRGFSGGTRDMYGEVLKFGAQIVDALVDYKQPVFVYIPPEGELRGGSWVVVDPSINPDVMEMYADQDSRGGILEPAGIVEVKFRAQQRVDLMHRLDDRLKALDERQKSAPSEDLTQEIRRREEALQPLYTQVACEFADLHDRAGRMKAVGVVRESLQWASAREFFFWRLRRSLLELRLCRDLQAADPKLSAAAAQQTVRGWLKEETGGSCSSDQQAVQLLQQMSVQKKVQAVHGRALKRQFHEVGEELARSGQLSGLQRCFLRCLFPGAQGAQSEARPRSEAPKVGAKELPGLLGNVAAKKPA